MSEKILQKSPASSIELENLVQDIPVYSLESYTERYLLKRESFRRSRLEMILIIVFCLLGAAWGVSWMDASAKAAIIFPEGSLRTFSESLFKFGIVATVGADGLFIMLTLSNNLGSKPSLFESKNRQPFSFKVLLSVILSFTSIIAPVYSAFKYNNGVSQLLVIIIFVVKFGYSLFGYSVLLDQITFLWKNFFSEIKEGDKKILSLKKRILQNLENLKENPTLLSEFSTGKAIVQYLVKTTPNFSTIEETVSFFKGHFKIILQASIAILIGMAAFAVDTFIITEVFEKTFLVSSAFTFPFAMVTAMPTLVVIILSSHRTLGEWIDFFFNKEKKNCLFKEHYSGFYKFSRKINFLISLLAPTAAAYITYDTLAGKIDDVLVWITVIFMIAARNIFAYFSLNQLFSKCVIFFGRRGKNQKAKNLDQSVRVHELIERIRKMSAQDLKALFNI